MRGSSYSRGVPLTPDGVERLSVELERVDEVVDPPRLVWVLDLVRYSEHRGNLYGWRAGAPRRALVVCHAYPLRDLVEWVCEPFVRDRHE